MAQDIVQLRLHFDGALIVLAVRKKREDHVYNATLLLLTDTQYCGGTDVQFTSLRPNSLAYSTHSQLYGEAALCHEHERTE